jgi:uncharacterized protein (TIGR03435 family)
MRTRLVPALCAALLLIAGTASGQAAPPPPAFEVATIKPAPPMDMAKVAADVQAGKMPKVGPHVTASQAEYSYMTLKDLIAVAYRAKPYQISGPDWLASERFDIVAKMPAGASTNDAPAMLQALLADRFKLQAHRDSQEHPVLALVVGKGGPKLKEATEPAVPIDPDAPLKPGEMKMDTLEGPARITRNSDGSATINLGAKGSFTQRMDPQAGVLRIEGNNLTMQGFAEMLTRIQQIGGGTGRQVVDMTGLTGNYQTAINISLADLLAAARAQGMNIPNPPAAPGAPASAGASPEASEPSDGSSVYESVQALGLKLEPRKATIEQLIVDHVEKAPTEN